MSKSETSWVDSLFIAANIHSTFTSSSLKPNAFDVSLDSLANEANEVRTSHAADCQSDEQGESDFKE